MITVFIRLNAATFIRFFEIRVRHLSEGGVYARAAFIKNQIYFLQTIAWQLTILI